MQNRCAPPLYEENAVDGDAGAASPSIWASVPVPARRVIDGTATVRRRHALDRPCAASHRHWLGHRRRDDRSSRRSRDRDRGRRACACGSACCRLDGCADRREHLDRRRCRVGRGHRDDLVRRGLTGHRQCYASLRDGGTLRSRRGHQRRRDTGRRRGRRRYGGRRRGRRLSSLDRGRLRNGASRGLGPGARDDCRRGHRGDTCGRRRCDGLRRCARHGSSPTRAGRRRRSRRSERPLTNTTRCAAELRA